MTAAVAHALSAADIALAYHTRTKHRFDRYAAGPETLDWDAQPNPFREFAGAPRTTLPLTADLLGTRFAQIYSPGGVAPVPFSAASIGALLELSMGLSAWKEYGPDRWAVRCNPSSGNLHPTETYVIASHVTGLDDGLYHYASRDHALELRSPGNTGEDASPRLWIGLSSIQWRESWKYGERAFRYCQLDIGHAIGAVRYAAGALGWNATVVENITSAELAAVLGLDRSDDFANAEKEDPDVLIAIEPYPAGGMDKAMPRRAAAPQGPWTGNANLLDRHPMYRWPVIDQVMAATRDRSTVAAAAAASYPPRPPVADMRAADVILGRRSAQRFDSKFRMTADTLYGLLDGMLARVTAPWDVWTFPAAIHPILFLHRVDGIEPGIYALARHPGALAALRDAMRTDFFWQSVDGAPPHLPFYKLAAVDCRAVAKTVSCHQAIAGDSCFMLSMIADSRRMWRLTRGATASFTGKPACWARCFISTPKQPDCAEPASVVISTMRCTTWSGYRASSSRRCTISRSESHLSTAASPARPDIRAAANPSTEQHNEDSERHSSGST